MSTRLLTLSALLAGALAFHPRPVDAAHDASATVSFWAFTPDASHFLLFVEDENRGPTLAVKAVGKQRSIHEVMTDGAPPQPFLRTPPLSGYRFTDAGVKGPQSPDGKVKIIGSMSATHFELMMKYGSIMVPMFNVPLDRDPSGQHVAKATVKEVVWSSSGRVAVLVINQAHEAHYGVNVDQVISFPTAPFYKKIKAAIGRMGGKKK